MKRIMNVEEIVFRYVEEIKLLEKNYTPVGDRLCVDANAFFLIQLASFGIEDFFQNFVQMP